MPLKPTTEPKLLYHGISPGGLHVKQLQEKNGKETTIVKSKAPPLLYGAEAIRALSGPMSSRLPFIDNRGAVSRLQRLNEITTANNLRKSKPLLQGTITSKMSSTASASSPSTSLQIKIPAKRQASVYVEEQILSDVKNLSNSTIGPKQIIDDKLVENLFPSLVDNNVGINELELEEEEVDKSYDFNVTIRGGTPSGCSEYETEVPEPSYIINNLNDSESRENSRPNPMKQYWARKEYTNEGPKKNEKKMSEDTYDSKKRLFLSDVHQMNAKAVLKNANNLLIQSSKLRQSNPPPLTGAPVDLEKIAQIEKPLKYQSARKGTYLYKERKEFLIRSGFDENDVEEFLLGKGWNKNIKPIKKNPKEYLHVKEGKTDMRLGPNKFKRNENSENLKTGKVTFTKPKVLKQQQNKSGKYNGNNNNNDNKKPIGFVLNTNKRKQIIKNSSKINLLEIKSSSSFDLGSTIDLSVIRKDSEQLKSTKNLLQRRFKQVLSKEVEHIENVNNIKMSIDWKKRLLQKIMDARSKIESSGKRTDVVKFSKWEVGGTKNIKIVPTLPKNWYPGPSRVGPSGLELKADINLLKKMAGEDEPKEQQIKLKGKMNEKNNKSTPDSPTSLYNKTKGFYKPPLENDSLQQIKERIMNPRIPYLMQQHIELEEMNKLMEENKKLKIKTIPPPTVPVSILKTNRKKDPTENEMDEAFLKEFEEFHRTLEKTSSSEPGTSQMLAPPHVTKSYDSNDSQDYPNNRYPMGLKLKKEHYVQSLYSRQKNKRFNNNRQISYTSVSNIDSSTNTMSHNDDIKTWKKHENHNNNKNKRVGNIGRIGMMTGIYTYNDIYSPSGIRNIDYNNIQNNGYYNSRTSNQSHSITKTTTDNMDLANLQRAQFLESLKQQRRIKRILEKQEDARYELTLSGIREKFAEYRRKH